MFEVAPDWWWLIAAGGYLLFTVVLGMLAPVILSRSSSPQLEDEALLRRLKHWPRTRACESKASM